MKISYDTLEREQQQMFLDIACFFINMEKMNPINMRDACDFHPALGLHTLICMSLVKIVEGDKIWMQDQLRDLGREIV